MFKVVEAIFAVARCEGYPDLVTKGCSSSTIQEYLSCIDARLDDIERSAASLLDLNKDLAFEARPGVVAHKPNMLLDSFLEHKSRARLAAVEPAVAHMAEAKKKIP